MGERIPYLDPQSLREVQAMRRVCEAAIGASKEEGEHRAGPYCAEAAYSARQKLREALVDLELARKGEG